MHLLALVQLVDFIRLATANNRAEEMALSLGDTFYFLNLDQSQKDLLNFKKKVSWASYIHCV